MRDVKNRAKAGYHMLMILSAVDGKLNGKEELIIKEFIQENIEHLKNPGHELEEIRRMESVDYAVAFNTAMNQFYMDSSPEQRNHFLDLATRLVAADKNISPRENLFLNELYNAWEESYE